MNKDVIYIDVDDDVTAIIGKIKKAKEKIVAIVPPKRAGALQSAVNLRLLERMAKTDKKKLVLITSNPALVALAANAQIPVAKNLQSKPELAEIPAIIVDDGDDIIDGSELPVGDHAKTVKVKDGTKPVPTDVRSEAIDSTDLEIDGVAVAATATAAKAATKKPKNRPKIPNFDTFRKKLFFAIAGGVGLIVLLIWMFVFAPSATVIITASTTPQPINAAVKLGGSTATDFKTGVLSSVTQSEQQSVTVEFEATGTKDVGEKATGTLRVSKLTQTPYGVPAGTKFTSSNGTVFATNAAVTVPASTPCFPAYCAQSVNVDVTAANSGTSSNGISGNATGPDGLTGAFQGATVGGSTKIAKVVSEADYDRAYGQLIGQSTDDKKAALIKKFNKDSIVIESSFTVDRGDVTSTPVVEAEAADGKATLTVPTTYSVQAVAKTELDSYLKASLNSKLDSDTQKLYVSGVDKATIGNFQKAEDGTLTATVNATGSIGPKINDDDIKNEVKGKKYGEVQQSLEAKDGIKEVDVQFSFFWVRTVPGNTDKITIEFKVDNE